MSLKAKSFLEIPRDSGKTPWMSDLSFSTNS